MLMADGRGSPDIELVASAIGISVRTLQRRLHRIGTTYAGVASQVRCDAALQMLKNPERRIGEVARTLGYAGSSAFHPGLPPVDGPHAAGVPPAHDA